MEMVACLNTVQLEDTDGPPAVKGAQCLLNYSHSEGSGWYYVCFVFVWDLKARC